MLVYKITNLVNNKIYVGQTTETLEMRLQRHFKDAYLLDTKLARAIKKYGKENFVIQQIDAAKTQGELNEKEVLWIRKLDSVNKGYNMTDGSCGGNTYKYKTEDEMRKIKDKISGTKIGSLNPNSKTIKCKNVFTDEELFFSCVEDCRKYFGDSNHNFVTRRVKHKTKFLYKGEWLIAYKDDEYITDFTYCVGDRNYRAKKVQVLDMQTGTVKTFNSLSSASIYFGYNPKAFASKRPKDTNKFIKFNRFEITVLN